MKRMTLVAALTVTLASCHLLDTPITTLTPEGETVQVQNPDGTPRTLGDEIADSLEENAPKAGGAGAAVGGPGIGVAVAGLFLAAATAIRTRKDKPLT
jgi:hypothetical protein